MDLSVYYQNVNGLRQKLNELFVSASDNQYDLIFLTETNLSDNIHDFELFSGGYNIYRRDRESTTSQKASGGGCLVAVRDNLNSTLIQDACSDAEDLYVIIHGARNLLLCCVYLPPRDTNAAELFYSNLKKVVDNYVNCIVLVIGDFNQPSVQWQISSHGYFVPTNYNRDAVNLINTLFYCNLQQYNMIKNENDRILDLVLCNECLVECVHQCTSPLVRVDKHHPPLELTLNVFFVKSIKDVDVYDYNFGKANYNIISDIIKQYDWENVLSLEVNPAVDKFQEIIESIISKNVPKRSKSSKRFPSWYSIATIKVIKEKNRAHKNWKRYKNPIDYLDFNLLRGRSKFLINTDYSKYLETVESNISSDCKHLWSFLKNKKNGSTYPNLMQYGDTFANGEKEICDLFSQYFSSVYENDPSAPGSITSKNTFCGTLTISSEDVTSRLRKLSVRKGPGPDGLPAVFLRNCSSALGQPLSILFNISLKECVYPRAWKRAHVVPIFKSGLKNRVENYRPVSILCTVSKVFETIIYDHLYSIVKTKIISQQHGFVQGRSVETNLISYTNYISQAMDSRIQVDAVYTDFSKAFDKLNHAILHKKLEKLGVCGSLLRWIISYISNRTQAVRLHNTLSDYIITTSGVPQGSHLGPLLFVIYLNDVHSCFLSSKFLLYADDLKLFNKIQNSSDTERLQADLNRFHDYCLSNKLFINYSKCNRITFTRNKNTINCQYTLGNNILTSVDKVKDLGVFLDAGLRYDEHISYIVNKSYKNLGFIIRICREFNNLKAIRTLYFSYVLSTLSYAAVVWSPKYKTYIDSLERIQRKFVGFLNRKFNNPFISYDQSYCEFHLLPLQTRRLITDSCFLMKIMNGLIDSTEILSLISLNACAYPTRSDWIFKTPFASTDARQQSCLLRITSAYNSNFSDIDMFCMSPQLFKRTLTKYCWSCRLSKLE